MQLAIEFHFCATTAVFKNLYCEQLTYMSEAHCPPRELCRSLSVSQILVGICPTEKRSPLSTAERVDVIGDVIRDQTQP
jgi:hypothetical protein